mmetsp:Transcript_3295/g.8190  ORF Transcript_3295/g.8190 Transcript_3295/m.8190 type:complete len:108 (+) Transcript_3295:605-928(+)
MQRRLAHKALASASFTTSSPCKSREWGVLHSGGSAENPIVREQQQRREGDARGCGDSGGSTPAGQSVLGAIQWELDRGGHGRGGSSCSDLGLEGARGVHAHQAIKGA